MPQFRESAKSSTVWRKRAELEKKKADFGEKEPDFKE